MKFKKKIKFKNIVLLILLMVFAFITIAGYEKNEADLKEDSAQDKMNFLLLINSENKLPDNYDAKLIKYKKATISSYIKNDLEKMFQDAKKDDVKLIINNAYRSSNEQKKIFDEKVEEYRDKGYSYPSAYKETKKTVNLPHYSEHETGLAIDFSSDEYSQNAPMWKWLYDNAYKYGFILRYPKEKESITKVSYEPWHYRYVGKSDAIKIYKSKLSLEEYLNNN